MEHAVALLQHCPPGTGKVGSDNAVVRQAVTADQQIAAFLDRPAEVLEAAADHRSRVRRTGCDRVFHTP